MKGLLQKITAADFRKAVKLLTIITLIVVIVGGAPLENPCPKCGKACALTDAYCSDCGAARRRSRLSQPRLKQQNG